MSRKEELEMINDCIDTLLDTKENHNLSVEILWSALQKLNISAKKFQDAINFGFFEWVK